MTHLIKARVEDVDVEDVAGHRWEFTQTLRDVAPEEWGGETIEP